MLNGLSDKQIISMLKTNSLWNKRACREILSRPDDFIPQLLDILDIAIDDSELSVDDNNSQHIPAALLLAQLREKQAYPRLVKLIECDEEDCDYLWGDLLTDYFNSILRDTYNGDSSLLPKLIENRSVSEWSRAMALKAYGMHYFDNHIGREEIIGFFRRLIHTVYAGKPNSADKTVLSYVAIVIREQQIEELIPDVQTLYSRNAIDTMMCEFFSKYTADFHAPVYKAEDLHLDNAIQELERWDWFKGKESSDDDDDDDYYDNDD